MAARSNAVKRIITFITKVFKIKGTGIYTIIQQQQQSFYSRFPCLRKGLAGGFSQQFPPLLMLLRTLPF